MNMTGSMGPLIHLTAMDVIVGLAVLLSLVFSVAWFLSQRLRVWVERPKYRFQADVRTYDQMRVRKDMLKGRNTL